MLDLPPPSMEIIPAVLVDVDEAQEQPENPGQAVVDPIPINEDFNPPVSSTPEIREGLYLQQRNIAKDCREKCKLKKQVLILRTQLAEMRKQNDKFRKSEKRLMARQQLGLREKFKQTVSREKASCYQFALQR